MTSNMQDIHPSPEPIRIERTFRRFSVAQRWEHALLLISVACLLLTGLPQKYQQANWSQWILSTPDRLEQLQQIHHIFALLLISGILYHLGHAVALMARRQLHEDIFPHWKDFKDAWIMIKHLLYMSREKPKFGKYNFEQKFTYWFLFFSIGILAVSGLILWFPLEITRVLPGGVIPAAFLTHSNEAIAVLVFIIVWHFYHVHFQRLNLSIFTGQLSEEEMVEFHRAEYEKLTAEEEMDAIKTGGNR